MNRPYGWRQRRRCGRARRSAANGFSAIATGRVRAAASTSDDAASSTMGGLKMPFFAASAWAPEFERRAASR